MRGFGLGILLVTVLGAGCAGPAPAPATGVLETVGFEAMRSSALAVAPVLRIPPSDAGFDAPDLVTDELHDQLFAALRGTRLVAPGLVRGALADSTRAGILIDVVKDLARRDAVDVRSTRLLGSELRERFLLVTWISESVETGTEPVRTDFEVSQFSATDGLATFERVVGSLEGRIVDLERGAVVWSGLEAYRSEPHYDGKGLVEELRRLRTGAAAAMVRQLEAS